MNIKKILSFNIEDSISRTIKNHLESIKLFFIIFAVNIIIFGQKIFFYSLAVDDYFRHYYYTQDSEMYLTRMAGRWAQDLLNNYIFSGGLQILPYFHGIIGVLSFTLLGFLTAKYFKQNNTLVIFIATLLISATPMFAHNLYFNTNITMWITTLLGVIGFLWAHKPNIFIKFIGFILLVIAIGNYQTIVQLILAMILFKGIIDLLEVKTLKDIKNILISSFLFVLFVLLAYAASAAINEFFIHYYDLLEEGRYRKAEKIYGLSIYLKRIVWMYNHYFDLFYFKRQLFALYAAMAFLSVIGIIFTIIKRNINKSIKLVSLSLIFLLLLFVPIIINLPLISGNAIPTRAHFTIGWVLAGFFSIQAILYKGVLKTISYIIAISIIVVSTYYIILFFDAASRQTNSDVTRINQIVNRIRMSKNYISEPLKFKIVGSKAFPVIGWKFKKEVLISNMSNYSAFKTFTDLKFTKMEDTEYNEMVDYLIQKGKTINAYPGKNSIVVYEDKAILFLEPNEINTAINISITPDRKSDIRLNDKLEEE